MNVEIEKLKTDLENALDHETAVEIIQRHNDLKKAGLRLKSDEFSCLKQITSHLVELRKQKKQEGIDLPIINFN